LLLQTPTPAAVAVPVALATLTIHDIDNAGVFQFAPSTYTVTEGSPVTLTVTRTGGSVGAVTVPWQASGFTPGDITPTSGNFSFITGLTSNTVTIMTAANSVIDGNSSITLTLGAPTGGGVPGTPITATLNILDKNNGGVIQFVNASQ